MYISEIQKRLMSLIDDMDFERAKEFAIKCGANEYEMTDAYHVALWFEGAHAAVKTGFLKLWEESAAAAVFTEDSGLRICSNCGRFMTEGYVLFGLEAYACSDKCATEIIMKNSRKNCMSHADRENAKELFHEILEDYPDDNFWTDWKRISTL